MTWQVAGGVLVLPWFGIWFTTGQIRPSLHLNHLFIYWHGLPRQGLKEVFSDSESKGNKMTVVSSYRITSATAILSLCSCFEMKAAPELRQPPLGVGAQACNAQHQSRRVSVSVWYYQKENWISKSLDFQTGIFRSPLKCKTSHPFHCRSLWGRYFSDSRTIDTNQRHSVYALQSTLGLLYSKHNEILVITPLAGKITQFTVCCYFFYMETLYFLINLIYIVSCRLCANWIDLFFPSKHLLP